MRMSSLSGLKENEKSIHPVFLKRTSLWPSSCRSVLNKPVMAALIFSGIVLFLFETPSAESLLSIERYAKHNLHDQACREIILQQIDLFEPTFKKELIQQIAHIDPAILLKYVNMHPGLAKTNLLKTVIAKAPSAAVRILGSSGKGTETIKRYLKKHHKRPGHEAINIIYSSNYDKTDKEKMAALINDIDNGQLTIEQAAAIAQDENQLFFHLIKINSQKNHLGSASVDNFLKKISLQKLNRIDNLYGENEQTQFLSVAVLDAPEIYVLMSYCGRHVNTTTFKGLSKRLIKKIEQEEIDGKNLINLVDHDKRLNFLRMAAGYNFLNCFLDRMDRKLEESLIIDYIRNIEITEPRYAIAAAADLFAMFRDNPFRLSVLRKTISQENRLSNQNKGHEDLYGSLIDLFGDERKIDETWMMETAARFNLQNPTRIMTRKLFNEKGENIQVHCFYKDLHETGGYDFKHFVDLYKTDVNWHLDSFDTYVLIQSNLSAGRKIQIYANIPEKEKQGLDDIVAVMEKRAVTPSIVVQRGHKGRLANTIHYGNILSKTRLFILGSCSDNGGYEDITEIIKKSPETQIIYSSGSGTREINLMIIEALNRQILSRLEINWAAFTQDLAHRYNHLITDFKDYMFPNRDVSALMIRIAHKQNKGIPDNVHEAISAEFAR